METIETVENIVEYMIKTSTLIRENYSIIRARITYRPRTRGIIIAKKIKEYW